MVKQTKRSRKFERKGGVKGLLLNKKGATLTKKGKLPRKKKKIDETNTPAVALARDGPSFQREKEEKREESNFISSKSVALGDLDMDGFFSSFYFNASSSDEDESSGDGDSEESDNDHHDEEQQEGKDSKKTEPADNENQVESSSDSSKDNDDSSTNRSDSSDTGSSDENIEKASLQLKKQMQSLETSDPDFHQFLKENESSLLEFDNDQQDEDDIADAKEQAGEETRDANESSKTQGATVLTLKLFKSLQKRAFELHQIQALKQVVAAYKSACHLADEDAKTKQQYAIESSSVFHNVMVSSLDRLHNEFHNHLTSSHKKEKQEEEEEHDFNKPLAPKLFGNSLHKNLKSVMESFFKSTIYILDHQAKDAELLAVILKKLAPNVRYLQPFPKLSTKLLVTLTKLWSSPRQDEQDFQVVRVEAFLRIRQMALVLPFPFVEECLKKTYLAYAQRAKFVTTSASDTSTSTSLPTLVFMGNCCVELYALDYHSSYQHAFVYIRQLALHLRTAIQKKTPQAQQQVCCWQYIHCLKLWTAVLVHASLSSSPSEAADLGQEDGANNHNDKSAPLLKSLVYPLVEVIEGMMGLIPTARHVPIRLHGVQMLQQLAAATQTYIPTSGTILEVLSFKEFNSTLKTHKKSNTRGVHLGQMLKFGKDQPLRTMEQQEAVMRELFQLLQREVDLYRYSAGFPELTVGICQRLQKFTKETKNSRWRSYAKGCIETFKRHSASAVNGRASLQETPKDVKVLEVLKPYQEPNMYARHQALLAKNQKVGSAAAAPLSRGQAQKATLQPENGTVKKDEKNKRKARIKDGEVGPGAKQKKAKKNSKLQRVHESDLKNVEALREDDQVEEGINWSDDESDA